MNETWRERKDGWNGDGAGWWMVEARRWMRRKRNGQQGSIKEEGKKSRWVSLARWLRPRSLPDFSSLFLFLSSLWLQTFAVDSMTPQRGVRNWLHPCKLEKKRKGKERRGDDTKEENYSPSRPRFFLLRMPLHSVSTSPIKSWRAPRRISLDTFSLLCRSAICIVETKEPRNSGIEREREKERERENKKILICIGLYSQKDDAFHYVEATRESGCLFVYVYIYISAKIMREKYKERFTWEENPFALSL